ncbi:FhaA domain-containing protein [Nocardioides sp. P5_C9_2]
MNALQRFERRLEQMISGVFARAFRSAVQPVEIAAALQRECDNNAQIMSRDRRLVPNRFLVLLAAVDLERLQGYDDAMERELVDQLKDHADTQGYVFTGPVHIDFEAADDLTTGRFRILSRAEASVTDNDQRTRTRAARAVLEVNGTRHPLRAPGLVVGRGTEADLRINDPGVSRRHIEFMVTGDDLEVVDLGSTNGMLVDGTKVGRAGLRDGTEVKIGHTTMTVRVTEEG